MKKEEIDRLIEGMNGIELNDAILAVCRAYDRLNQENELKVVALPKYNKRKREEVIQYFCELARKDHF